MRNKNEFSIQNKAEPQNKNMAKPNLNSKIENKDYEAKLRRLDRDLQYFQRLLREAHPREKLEIHHQLLAVLTKKKGVIQRQTDQKRLENERLARAVEALTRMRDEN
jgi:hypothetical protein